jgi:putative Mg2+ transporter-C (MgtC) family protein
MISLMPRESEIIIRIIFASLLGLILGVQREKRKTVEHNYGIAGMRTHTIVALASALVTAIGALAFPADPIRLAASILTGIGFIGAGTIIANQGKIKGLVNASSVWVASAIGIACGLGYFVSSIIGVLLVIMVLELKRFEKID